MARCFRLMALLALLLTTLVACSGGNTPITLNDVPVFNNAQALELGKNPMADTLAQNVQQADAMGAKLDQKMFTLPKDTTWETVQAFYKEKLEGAGWKSANLPVPANDVMQMSVWTRGTQSLTVAQITEPVSKDMFLLFSLSSQ